MSPLCLLWPFKERCKCFNIFIDDKLSRGEEISASLLEVIEESKISIVMISENFGSSSRCLNELVKIIKCNKFKGQVVLPVFYKVDPSQVRKQIGTFGEAFAKLEERFFNKMEAWREALTTVSHMSGWVLREENEANLIQEIVQEVLKKLDHATMQLHVAKYPVGIAKQIMNLLSQVMSDGITMVGLYGIGGMGKTTLAKALYNKIANKFEGCCFLANIRETSKQYEGLVRLQEKLIYEILMDGFIKVSNIHRGINIIRDRLCAKKILLILDDIDTSEQLQALAGGHDWFGPGSKVIATTRNNHLLAIHGFDILESVDGLNHNEALELFSWHAFKKSHPSSDYLDLSLRGVLYCKGLPLALEMLGSFLCSIDDQLKFKRILDEFQNSHLDKDIKDILQVSYDALEEDVKEIFLYISCFFVRENVNKVKMMLKECGSLCFEKAITKLMNLSLLTINKFNDIEMHDLIQQMGCTIALSGTCKSHKRKRLLIEDDDVLNGNKEARAVKAIKMGFHQSIELNIDSRAFEKVKNLVVLEVDNVTSSKTLDYLPSSLRWMSWSKFPFSSLPSSYSMEKLIELKLPYSSIKHFGKGFMRCESLKHIDLTDSKFLEEIPDLSAAINLEELILWLCMNLKKVHESVGSLGKLVTLELCSHSKGFKQFPHYLNLKSLKYLDMEQCNMTECDFYFSEEMKSFEYLRFRGCDVKELSPTIGYLVGLKSISITCTEFALTSLPSTIYRLSKLTSLVVEYSNLSTFPSLIPSCSPPSFPNLIELQLKKCNITNLSFLETLTQAAPSLRELNLTGNNFSSVPSCIVNFKSLRYFKIKKCKWLEEISMVPKGIILMNARGCISLTRFPNNLADIISSDSEHQVDGEFRRILLMNCDIPEWYSYKSMNNSITFFMPINPSRKLKALAPCIIFQVIDVTNIDQRYRCRGTELECKVSINDIQVWSSEKVLDLETSKNYGHFKLKPSPNLYMWLIALDPNRDFHPNWINEEGKWNDFRERSEIDLNQPCYEINSTEMNCNNVDDVSKKFTVSFKVKDMYKDSIVWIKRCGVHVIMEG